MVSEPSQRWSEPNRSASYNSHPGTPRLDAENPWPGLAAYNEASHNFFHGRKCEADELLRMIRLAPVTALYGKSGLGKTSLLQAGLFPLLRRHDYLPVYLNVDFSDNATDPLDQVAHCLDKEVALLEAECPHRRESEGLWEYLHREDMEIWIKSNNTFPVLVFDQFDELFSGGIGDAGRVQEFRDSMADLIENRIPVALASEASRHRWSQLNFVSQNYGIVLAFREEHLPDIKSWEKQVPSLLRNFLRLAPMTRQCAIEVVQYSGHAVLGDDVAPLIVDFVGKADEKASATTKAVIEPVLLSLCCYQLNRRRKKGEKISRALIESAAHDILDSFYREALNDDDVKGPPGAPDVATFIETFLVHGDRFRGNYPKAEATDKNLITQTQLEVLVDRYRLLRVIEYADTARIELIHDRLIEVVRKARSASASLYQFGRLIQTEFDQLSGKLTSLTKPSFQQTMMSDSVSLEEFVNSFFHYKDSFEKSACIRNSETLQDLFGKTQRALAAFCTKRPNDNLRETFEAIRARASGFARMHYALLSDIAHVFEERDNVVACLLLIEKRKTEERVIHLPTSVHAKCRWMLNTCLGLASQAGLFLKQIAHAVELTPAVPMERTYDSAPLASERRDPRWNYKNGQESTRIAELKDGHEKLYTLMISNRGKNQGPLISNARTFVSQLGDVARTVKSLDHYTWLANAVLQWQIAFSSVLEEPLRQRIPDPPDDLIAPPYPVPEHVGSHSLWISLWRRLSDVSSSKEERDHDWYQAQVYFASQVLDGTISFADQVDEHGFEYLKMVRFRDVIKVKAYFRWWHRVINARQPTEESLQDYFYACHYYRWRLLDAQSKAGRQYFNRVDSYIIRNNVADEALKKLNVDKCDEQRATQYVRKFYYNIGSAVLQNGEESKRKVVEAILESEGPGSQLSIMNAFEAAIAIYFLRDLQGLPEEWYQQANDFKENALWRRAT